MIGSKVMVTHLIRNSLREWARFDNYLREVLKMYPAGDGVDITSFQTELYYKGNDPAAEESINVNSFHISLNYLGVEGKVNNREALLYCPDNKNQKKFPLIIEIHYGINEEDDRLYNYLDKGWAVLTPIKIPEEHLANIIGNDLRFNNALVAFSRRLDFIDHTRIGLRGGSAGGYQVMMLSALLLGINSSNNISGVVNMPYQFNYLKENNKFNTTYDEQLTEEEREDPENYPIPIIKSIYDMFLSTAEELSSGEKGMRYSPVSHLKEISNPVLMIHSTADILVPIYQIMKSKGYNKVGNSLPDNFKFQLPELTDLPELKKSLVELIQEDEITVFNLKPEQIKEQRELKFTLAKKYSLTIIDEGKIEKDCNHFKNEEAMAVSDIAFFEYNLNLKSEMTNDLPFIKLKSLAQRYLGIHPLLAEENDYKHEINPAIFGSLASDRIDVLLEIITYIGLEVSYYRRKVLKNENLSSIKYIRENLQDLISKYNQLPDELKFMEKELAEKSDENIKSFASNPINSLLKLIEYYRNTVNISFPF